MGLHVVRQSNRGFGITFAVVFALVFSIAWLGFDARLDWAAVLAILFLAAAFVCSGILLPLNRLWSAFASRFGYVNNHLVLGIFYYLVMAPAGLLMRAVGYDPMNSRPQKKLDTYWQPVRRNTDRENLTDMF